MASDNKAQKQRENAYQATATAATGKADAAIETASKPNPLLERITKNVTAMDDWKHGVDAAGNKVPVDARNMPGADVGMSLFNDALKVNDAKRVGGGMGTMGDSVNPNFVAAVDKQNEMERHKMAAGGLENFVDRSIAANDETLGRVAAQGEQRNQFVAGLRASGAESAEDRALRYFTRQKQPNFFRELAMNAAQGSGGAALGMI